MGEEQASKAKIEADEREMLDRAAHEDDDERQHRAEASRRRKQTQRDRR
jgi:hypothetical protein